MKIYGIFRGFAGLGRVVSGMGIIKRFEKDGCEVRVFTYAQGLSIAKEYGISCMPVKGDTDIGFMGIVPISPTGLAVVDDVLKWNPDCVLVDGEPLIIDCLRTVGIKGKIVALTNPLDLYSPTNNPITMKYFKHLFCQSDMILCHGLQSIEKSLTKIEKKKVFCLNTILRGEILDIKRSNPKYITCILGGGTQRCSRDFVLSTIEIAKRVILVAQQRPDLEFRIYCNDISIGTEIERLKPENVSVITEYTSPAKMYKDSILVIARAGRNTLSELLYLRIPSIVIPILGNVVSIEQNNNINIVSRLSRNNIIGYNLDDVPETILDAFDYIYNNKERTYDKWMCGNKKAFQLIQNLLGYEFFHDM